MDNNNEPILVDLAPFIYNRSAFYFREHPKLHPDTVEYMDYWEEHEIRGIEGLWALDQQSDTYDSSKPGGWRFMTPQHYWYTNFCFIRHMPDETKAAMTIMPDARDIDWYWFYVFILGCGFSGFELDTEYSCHELLHRYYKSKEPGSKTTFELTPREKITWNNIQNSIKKPDGTYKKYMYAIDYLSQTFSKPLGRILYENPMYNIADLEARGGGKTYRMIGVLSQYFTFYGARTFEDYLEVDQGPRLCVGSAVSSKSGSLLKKFQFSQSKLAENFGSWEDPVTKEFTPGFFHRKTSGVITPGNEKNPYREEWRELRSGTWLDKGTRTSIVHQSYDNNPEAFVGGRSPLMLEDEFGLNPISIACAHADNTIMKMSGVKMGIALKSGTGGNVKKIQQSKEIFYNPVDYGYISLPDHWEGSPGGIGMFVPAYYVDSSFRDPQGNQNIKLAWKQEILNRKQYADGNSTKMLDGYIIDHPLAPSEMFLSPEVNIFPTQLIRDHILDLKANRTFEILASVGYLSYTKDGKGVTWTNYKDKYNKPILDWDVKKYDGRLESSIVVYEHPPDVVPNPTLKKSMYKITYDPVNDDFGGTSLCSIIVYKSSSVDDWNSGMKNTIVATYHGRMDSVDDMHDIAIKLALYYNARILPETNLPDFVRYAKRAGHYRLLQLRPWDAITTLVGGKRVAKYDVGMRMGKAENLQGEQLIRQFLLEERGVDPDSGKKILNLHHIYDLKLLDELVNYTRENNTDAVSAFKLLMFWIYQEQAAPLENPNNKVKTQSKFDAYLNKKTVAQVKNKNKAYYSSW